MRIIYLHQYFTTPDMAGGTRSYEMARRLVEWGHTVEMITTWREPIDKKDWFETVEAGIKVHWLPVLYSNKMGFWKRILAFLRFSIKSALKAVSIEGDLIFATSTPLTIAIPGVLASKLKKIPLVFEVRDLWPIVPIALGELRNPLFKQMAYLLEKFAYKHSSHIIALSPGMMEGIHKSGYPLNKISMIPNSADLELFKPEPGKSLSSEISLKIGKGTVVLYPGTLGRVNGVSYLAELAALVAVHRPDFRFVVVGDGAEWGKVETKARMLGVLNKTFFMLKSIPKIELIPFFHYADMIISLVIDIPELQANSANKFFDALSSGTPVCINYEGWQADLIREHCVGLVLSAQPEEAVSPFLNFFDNPEEVEKSGMRARQLAETHFSRDILAKKLEKVFIDVICEKTDYSNN